MNCSSDYDVVLLEVGLIASTTVPQLSEMEVLAEITEDFEVGEYLTHGGETWETAGFPLHNSISCLPTIQRFVMQLLNPSGEPVSVSANSVVVSMYQCQLTQL